MRWSEAQQPAARLQCIAVGTDFLHLLDRRRAEIIIHANESELASLVDVATGLMRPHVWANYWDAKKEKSVDFFPTILSAERLRVLLGNGETIEVIKEELLRELCTGGWLYVDYWGCYAEVFAGGDPPGAVTWEAFTKAMHPENTSAKPDGASGCYLLTNDNVDSILRSLEEHRAEVKIMNESQIAQLKAWRDFCRKFTGFCVLYQIDF
jgi:hypothetical protein